MALQRPQTPRRIPPAEYRQQIPINTTDAPQSPQAEADASHLAKDGYALQEQLDSLVEQFEQMQSQLRQAQKLASLGTTAAMIAHEFNNLYTPVVAYAKQALDTDDVELMRIALTKTLDRTETMREMADRVIGLAKSPTPGISDVNVADLAHNAVSCLCRNLDKDNIEVKIEIDPALTVRANENQLLQVMFNLVINARQAMLGRRGRLIIQAASTPEGKVDINVRDSGCGISQENLERIFEPFFSTKKDAEKADRRGLGLGLAICQNIIEDLDGKISVTSEVDVGTTFTITLPQGH
jgi:C4-dicarboxylate-specific signal transduction histidine kinase